jgi:GT2 family glycosyltransferase
MYRNYVKVVTDKLEGAVPAFNQAFAETTGEYVALINDDVELLIAGALDTAVARLQADPSAGQLAFAFTRNGQKGDAKIEYSHSGKPYANLGMIKRSVAEEVIKITGGIWTPLYRTYGADTELSCWVHRLGYKVLEARDLIFWDKMCVDELRKLNYGPNRATCDKDGKLFWSRWPDPKMLKPFGPYPNVTERELEALKAYEARVKKAHD